MDYRSYEKRLDYVLELITKNRFRSIETVAQNFSCSTRTIKRMINHLRDRGHDIIYDKRLKKYLIKEKE
ncbi:HTH domain-containing protein [Mucilaginibacter rubeus]|uniref:HTH domain-containing protein n=1 Tax=Mucilaginibacter rubeus TaxID=2027860 RepID=UPI00166D9386|nr:HTH domain-containing protein [Mucilaginibacter rubeus]